MYLFRLKTLWLTTLNLGNHVGRKIPSSPDDSGSEYEYEVEHSHIYDITSDEDDRPLKQLKYTVNQKEKQKQVRYDPMTPSDAIDDKTRWDHEESFNNILS